MTPMSPSGPDSHTEAKQKRANPLTDLIDTEKSYVDQLTGIIRVRIKLPAQWRLLMLRAESCRGMVSFESSAAGAGYNLSQHRGCLQG
jgi:hypothetical protein